MKISLKLQDEHHHKNHHTPPLLLRAKIPITILNLPFLSHFSTTTTHPSDLALSLSTNFPSFPSIKVSYATAASAAAPPFSLTLKSGTGVFGSPKNSPLVISAHFSFNPSNPSNRNPTFSLFFKPQLGSFSLRKSTFSHPQSSASSDSTNGDTVSDPNSFAFVPLESPESAKKLSLDSNDGNSIFKGIQLAARTHMPVAKSVALNFRWWLNISDDQMPVLRINKIGIQGVDAGPKNEEKKKKGERERERELEVVKGMCFWMKRELDVLTRVNREMKCELEEMKVAQSRHGELKEGVGKKKVMPSIGSSSSGFKLQRRATRNGGGEDNGNGNGNVEEKREEKKKGNLASDMESEFQRAIAAATASSS